MNAGYKLQRIQQSIVRDNHAFKYYVNHSSRDWRFSGGSGGDSAGPRVVDEARERVREQTERTGEGGECEGVRHGRRSAVALEPFSRFQRHVSSDKDVDAE